MHDPRFGNAVRALRRRRGWRQVDLARAATISRSLVSAIERGRVEPLTLKTLRSVAAALDATVAVEVRWRGGALDRLLDERHAFLSAAVASMLEARGWLVRPEVSYSVYGERGSIDLVAWHETTRSLLIVEVKTELTSIQVTLRKHDEKVRLGPRVVGDRFGWRTVAVSGVLVLPATTSSHRHVQRHAAILDAALPARTRAVQEWIRAPSGTLAGILFVPDVSHRGVKSGATTPHRVRHRGQPPLMQADASNPP